MQNENKEGVILSLRNSLRYYYLS